MERKGRRVKLGEKRLQMSCVLEAGQPWGVCAIGAEGRQRECGSGPLSGMSPGIRPRGAAAFHPSPAAGAREQQRSTHRTSWERAASVPLYGRQQGLHERNFQRVRVGFTRYRLLCFLLSFLFCSCSFRALAMVDVMH